MPWLRRPKFLPIVASATLATMLTASPMDPSTDLSSKGLRPAATMRRPVEKRNSTIAVSPSMANEMLWISKPCEH